MGFWDDHPAPTGGGGTYVGKEEKKAMADTGVVFDIVKCEGPSRGKFGMEYHVTISGDDGEERILNFSADAFESRARWLDEIVVYFQGGGEPFQAKLVHAGTAYNLADPDSTDE